MYLKQLVCKGFKSFADRSVLELEPGITAVVGPNGSGKSNISDAVLWVLGERNAKNLRGQVMEDVIFAGSSARKSVGVAEVSLVLDNSDGSLPVEYDEVTISRRMYRSGESEYLVNGSTVRRLDVLDILHDSGLGTGTHSIISQGHLDSILQSRPEDRRALIEEAAGVLKHKQRKEKSQRKIAQMDQHLARVTDVVNEIERQLGPLQRKARRAMQYQEVSAQLDQVKLALAVDTLRTLQAQWDQMGADEAHKQEKVELQRAKVEQLEQEYDAIQELIRRESTDVAGLVQLQTRSASLGDRFDSLGMLLKEKRRVTDARCAELNRTLEANAQKRSDAQAQRSQAAQDLEQARLDRSGAQAKLDESNKAYDQAHNERVTLEQELSACQRNRGNAEREAEGKRRELARTQERLAQSQGQAKAANDRLADIDTRVAEAKAAHSDVAARLEQAATAVAAAEAEEKAASQRMTQCREQRDQLRKKADQARAAAHSLAAELQGIHEVERAMMAAAGPAHAWVAQQTDQGWGAVSPLYDCLDVEASFEPLVERILGSDVTALLVQDRDCVRRIGRALADSGRNGTVTLVTDGQQREVACPAGCELLVDKVSGADEVLGTVRALLGDVLVCDTVSHALTVRDEAPFARFVTRDGGVVWPNGKVQLGKPAAAEGGATLARAKRVKQIERELADAQAQLEQLTKQAEEAAQQAQQAQDASLRLRQEMADARGKHQSLQRECESVSRRASQAEGERESSERAQRMAQEAVAECEPRVLALKDEIARLEQTAESCKTQASAIRNKVYPLRDKEQDLAAKLADAKVSFATLTERETFAVRTMDERSKELLRLSAADDEAFAQLSAKKAAAKRIDPLIEVIAALGGSVREKALEVASQATQAQEASLATHGKASCARDAVKLAHAQLDAANEEMSALLVSKGRLELQVQASVDCIVHDCGANMEEALRLPQLENRAEAEEQSFKLQRRISNLGVINPEAAKEYEELKERYDYLKAQLDDLASARAALKKIDRVIDDRMKDDFANTFETVNGYFKEIFAELFPGGTAELSLVDPDDLENTGVEVTAQPRGKRITKMTLMSGGEKSLVACALLFAVYRTRTTPFYILDEIEAALDDSNLRRLIKYLEELSHHTQLIMITHQRRTMEMADVLFGVSMQADGVTKVISQRLDKALQYAQ